MSKAEILAELPKLQPEERREVLDRICELDRAAEETWMDGGELTAQDKSLLEEALVDYQKSPDAGTPWEEVLNRLRPQP